MRGIARLPCMLALANLVAGCGGASKQPAAGTGANAAPLQVLAVPPAGMMYHGVFPAGEKPDPSNDISVDALDAYEGAVRRKVAWVYFDDEWHDSRAFPATTAGWIRARGSVPFIRLMMRSQKVPLVVDPVFTL